MVLASRLGLTPTSAAQTAAALSVDSSPLNGPINAQTFREIAKTVSPAVVYIRTEMKAKAGDLSDFLGGRGGNTPDDFFRRFFGGPNGGGGDQEQRQGQGERQRRGEQRPPPNARASGTGVVINGQGWLSLIHNHIVEG